MTREEIVTALRRCKLHVPYSCVPCPAKLPHGNCMTPLHSAAADLIESQQREIEALRQANEGLRFNLDLWTDFVRKNVGADDPVRPSEIIRSSSGPTESSAPTKMIGGGVA